MHGTSCSTLSQCLKAKGCSVSERDVIAFSVVQLAGRFGGELFYPLFMLFLTVLSITDDILLCFIVFKEMNYSITRPIQEVWNMGKVRNNACCHRIPSHRLFGDHQSLRAGLSEILQGHVAVLLSPLCECPAGIVLGL